MAKPPEYIAAHLRRVLQDGASAPHTAEVERFFKDEIQSRGWYTDEIRRLARRFRRVLLNEAGLDYLVEVADRLFHGNVLEEKILAVCLLQSPSFPHRPKGQREQKSANEPGLRELRLLEKWLDRVSTWADHDGLATFLIGPIVVAHPRETARVLRWARSRDRWHRRAAAVSLICGAGRGLFDREIRQVTQALLGDEDDMVRKGLGWLLRVHAKVSPERALPLLRSIAPTAPRLVLRTACETVSPAERKAILAIGSAKSVPAQKPARRRIPAKAATALAKVK